MGTDAMLETGELNGFAAWKRVLKATKERRSKDRPPDQPCNRRWLRPRTHSQTKHSNQPFSASFRASEIHSSALVPCATVPKALRSCSGDVRANSANDLMPDR